MPTESGTQEQPPASTQYCGNQEFAPALLDPDLDIPAGMVGPDGNLAPKRFSVYRNNVVLSLMEAMAETFPAIKIIVGEENFATVSRIFISSHPPSSPMMQAYGDLFPEFLRDFGPLQSFPFLEDVAKVEICWINAYHAADANPLDGAVLGAIDPETLIETSFAPHPAADLVTSNYALHHLFSSRNGEGGALNFKKCAHIQSVLITRAQLSVEVHELDHAGTAFFKNILQANTLGQCIEQAMEADKNFEPSSAITLMLTSGAVTSLSNQPQTNSGEPQ